ncbi:MAG: hypothetical protein AAFP98_10230 [Pseudomonadota bacterium]
MLKSIYEGYLPTIVLAVIGYSMLGGGFMTWLAFVWVFGAVFTVGVAYLRSRFESPEIRPQQAMGAMENC